MKIMEFRGARDLVASIIETDSIEEYVAGEYFPVAGLQKIAKTTQSESATKHYDNAPAIIIDAVGEDKVTLTISVLDLATYAKVLGMQIDTVSGALIEGESNAPYVAIGYITGLVGGGERFVSRLKGKFSIPDEEVDTADSGTGSTNMQLTYTGINTTHRFDKTKKTAKAVIGDEVSTPKIDFSKFFTQVVTPDNIPLKSAGA